MTEENEFEKQYSEDDFAEGGEDIMSDDSDINGQPAQEDIVAGSAGLEFDISKASRTTKGPERENLDGKEVVITDVKVILPKPESEWQLSKNGKVKYKTCQFILFYDNDGQREYYSGMKVFEREENGVKKYSEPVIQNNGKNQASMLKTVYAKYKEKKPEEISMYEFLSFLQSKPKALIESQEFEYDDRKTNKNIVVKFLG
jgi:hypothetical protein